MTTLELIKKLVNLGCVEFEGSVPWYSNGLRGYLHGSNSCDKLRANDTITQHFTFKQAFTSGKTICRDCDKGLIRTNEARTAIQSATFLDSVDRTVAHLLGKVTSDTFSGYPGLLALRYNMALRNLRNDVERRGTMSGLESWRNKCMALIDSSLLLESPHTVYDESLRYAALSHLSTTLQNRDNLSTGNLWGGDAAMAVCGTLAGYPLPKSNPLRNLNSVWFATHNNSHSTHQDIADTIFDKTEISKLIGTPEGLHLLNFASPSMPDSNETVIEFATRAWADKVSDILRDVSSLWASKYDEYLSEHDLVAFGVIGGDRLADRLEYSEANGGGIPDPVIIAHTIVRPQAVSGNYGHTVVVCPAIVAKYIENLCTTRGPYRYEVTCKVTDVGARHAEHAETAAALWSPRDKSSVYLSFETAYKAAVEL